MDEKQNETFTCESCGCVFPMYVDDQLQPSCGMNLGWGELHWCRECRPPGGTAEQIIADMEAFMFPKED